MEASILEQSYCMGAPMEDFKTSTRAMLEVVRGEKARLKKRMGPYSDEKAGNGLPRSGSYCRAACKAENKSPPPPYGLPWGKFPEAREGYSRGAGQDTYGPKPCGTHPLRWENPCDAVT